MLGIMALEVQGMIVKDIQSSEFFSIMADETADVSNAEQFTKSLDRLRKTLKSTKSL